MDRIPNETGPITILCILFILSKTLNATFWTTVHFPRKLSSFLPSFFWYGMAVKQRRVDVTPSPSLARWRSLPT